MATINLETSFIGPLPDTDNEYLLRINYSDHHAFEATAGDMDSEIFPLSVMARSVFPDTEEPREAVLKVICPKLKALSLTAEDLEDPSATAQASLEPRPFAEGDVIPELLQATFDLTEDGEDGAEGILPGSNQRVTYRVLPGRRTRLLTYG